ncbi:unnamed protein product (mitochondrion) [Plasmodiophora brassicae]|uniref:HECT domain-containing protein n=1 Tax=Plasmodiophora brassicae TaxID=37360 RepID=A0A3P3YD38_PLABS|nr:unnamed protein product [Plasmodiophora brassicae]
MPGIASTLAMLVHLLAGASVYANDPTTRACPEWSTLAGLNTFLQLAAEDRVQWCAETMLVRAVEAGLPDFVDAITRCERARVGGPVVIRATWYAYALWRRHDGSSFGHVLEALVSMVQSIYRITSSAAILRDMGAHYSGLATAVNLADRAAILGNAPTFSYVTNGEPTSRPPEQQSEPMSLDLTLRPPAGQRARGPESRSSTNVGVDPPVHDHNPPLHDFLGLSIVPQQPTYPPGDSKPDRQPHLAASRDTHRMITVIRRDQAHQPRQPSPSTHRRYRTMVCVVDKATIEKRLRHNQADLGLVIDALFRRLVDEAAASIWKYTLRDGTQQEQGQLFLDAVAAMIYVRDARLRGQMFVMSESSRAIDNGGLSASLIQFAATELARRLARSGQLLYSQGMDQAFAPRSPTVDTEAERRDLILLGALIGIVDNHKRRVVAGTRLLLPIPLPVVAFRALLMSVPIKATGAEANGTALAAIYRQYCGDRSPVQCKHEKGIDVELVFGSVPGVDYSNADEYLRGLVDLLLQSPAFDAVRQGYRAVARRPSRSNVDRDRQGHLEMHALVIADSVVTCGKLLPFISFNVERRLRRSNATDARMVWSAYHAIRSLSDVECADFVEASTGARCLPLTIDDHSRIKVTVRRSNGISFHTCFRTVEVSNALICAGSSALALHLRYSMRSLLGRGITSASFNDA